VPPDADAAHIGFGLFSLDAETIRMNMKDAEVSAEGHVVLSSPDGLFNADSARFNTVTKAGYLDRVTGCFEPFRFAAQSMTMDANGTKQVQRVHLTTCLHEHPHYALQARDFTVDGDGRFRVRKAGLAIGGHRLATLPSIHGKIGGKSAEIASPALTGGVSSIDGTYVAVNYEYSLADDRDFLLTGRTGTAGLVRGRASYTQPLKLGGDLDDGTISLHTSWKEDVQNRLIASDLFVDQRLEKLTISRLPALQAFFPTLPLRGSLDGFALRLGAGFGRYREDPTNVKKQRSQLWSVLVSPKVKAGPLRAYGEFGLRTAFYPGEGHTTNVLQLTLETPPELPAYLNLSYLRRRERGTSPFLFDRVLMPDELYSEVEFPVKKGSQWWLNLANRYDLDSGRSRDFAATAIYKLDCISYGLTYNRAGRSFGVGMVLNAFGSFHKGVGGIGFTQ
jgi:hypothetical protein